MYGMRLVSQYYRVFLFSYLYRMCPGTKRHVTSLVVKGEVLDVE